jgi:hypothetical protein
MTTLVACEFTSEFESAISKFTIESLDSTHLRVTTPTAIRTMSFQAQ